MAMKVHYLPKKQPLTTPLTISFFIFFFISTLLRPLQATDKGRATYYGYKINLDQ